eukprot:g2806.t1
MKLVSTKSKKGSKKKYRSDCSKKQQKRPRRRQKPLQRQCSRKEKKAPLPKKEIGLSTEDERAKHRKYITICAQGSTTVSDDVDVSIEYEGLDWVTLGLAANVDSKSSSKSKHSTSKSTTASPDDGVSPCSASSSELDDENDEDADDANMPTKPKRKDKNEKRLSSTDMSSSGGEEEDGDDGLGDPGVERSPEELQRLEAERAARAEAKRLKNREKRRRAKLIWAHAYYDHWKPLEYGMRVGINNAYLLPYDLNGRPRFFGAPDLFVYDRLSFEPGNTDCWSLGGTSNSGQPAQHLDVRAGSSVSWDHDAEDFQPNWRTCCATDAAGSVHPVGYEPYFGRVNRTEFSGNARCFGGLQEHTTSSNGVGAAGGAPEVEVLEQKDHDPPLAALLSFELCCQRAKPVLHGYVNEGAALFDNVEEVNFGIEETQAGANLIEIVNRVLVEVGDGSGGSFDFEHHARVSHHAPLLRNFEIVARQVVHGLVAALRGGATTTRAVGQLLAGAAAGSTSAFFLSAYDAVVARYRVFMAGHQPPLISSSASLNARAGLQQAVSVSRFSSGSGSSLHQTHENFHVAASGVRVVAVLTSIPTRLEQTRSVLDALRFQSYALHKVYLFLPTRFGRNGERYVLPNWLLRYNRDVHSPKRVHPPPLLQIEYCEEYGLLTRHACVLEHEKEPLTKLWFVQDDHLAHPLLLERLLRVAILVFPGDAITAGNPKLAYGGVRGREGDEEEERTVSQLESCFHSASCLLERKMLDNGLNSVEEWFGVGVMEPAVTCRRIGDDGWASIYVHMIKRFVLRSLVEGEQLLLHQQRRQRFSLRLEDTLSFSAAPVNWDDNDIDGPLPVRFGDLDATFVPVVAGAGKTGEAAESESRLERSLSSHQMERIFADEGLQRASVALSTPTWIHTVVEQPYHPEILFGTSAQSDAGPGTTLTTTNGWRQPTNPRVAFVSAPMRMQPQELRDQEKERGPQPPRRSLSSGADTPWLTGPRTPPLYQDLFKHGFIEYIQDACGLQKHKIALDVVHKLERGVQTVIGEVLLDDQELQLWVASVVTNMIQNDVVLSVAGFKRILRMRAKLSVANRKKTVLKALFEDEILEVS